MEYIKIVWTLFACCLIGYMLLDTAEITLKDIVDYYIEWLKGTAKNLDRFANSREYAVREQINKKVFVILSEFNNSLPSAKEACRVLTNSEASVIVKGIATDAEKRRVDLEASQGLQYGDE